MSSVSPGMEFKGEHSLWFSCTEGLHAFVVSKPATETQTFSLFSGWEVNIFQSVVWIPVDLRARFRFSPKIEFTEKFKASSGCSAHQCRGWNDLIHEGYIYQIRKKNNTFLTFDVSSNVEIFVSQHGRWMSVFAALKALDRFSNKPMILSLHLHACIPPAFC